jgi:hypothetical protein
MIKVGDRVRNIRTKVYKDEPIVVIDIYDNKRYHKFFGTVEKRFSEVNLANANNGRTITVDTITKCYIFIEEIKTIAENRDEKLKEIL